MKRTGKIAQLPMWVREQLNRRLQQGQSGKGLVAWLNGLAEVKESLAAEFDGRPIREQNLSDWRQGGYQDWLRQEESRHRLERLDEQAHALTGCGEEGGTTDRLSAVLSAELAGAIEAVMAEPLPPFERWKRLREILRDVTQLRREDHRAAWLRIGQERWQHDSARLEWEEEERVKKELRRIREKPFWDQMRIRMMANFFGGGEKGRKLAARMVEFEEGLAEGTLSGAAKPAKARRTTRENPRRSTRIKPDPTQSK